MSDRSATADRGGLRVGTWSFDYASRTLTWSQGAHLVFGTAPESFTGRPEEFEELVHSDDLRRLHDAISRAEGSQGSFDLTFRIKRPDGTERVVHESGEIVFNENGKPVSNSGVVVDVTENAEAEKRSRRNSALASMAGRIAKIGGWSSDIESRQCTWSDEVCEILGVPAGFRPSREMANDFIAAEYRDGLNQAFSACIEQGHPFDREVQIVTTTQERVWVRIIGEPIRDDAGTITSVQGALQDLTCLKQREFSPDASRQRLRQLADAMPMIVWTARPDGAVDYANQRLLDYAGASDLGVAGQAWIDALHPEDLATPMRLGPRSPNAASPISVSSGCADTTASIAGISPAPSRHTMTPAQSQDGTARRWTSMTAYR